MIRSSHIEEMLRKEVGYWMRQYEEEHTDFKRGVLHFAKIAQRIVAEEKQVATIDYRELGARRAYKTITLAHALLRSGNRADCLKVLDKMVVYLKQKEKSLRAAH